MASRFLRINGYTRSDRNEMTWRVKEAITSSGGWIIDFKQFSNVSICINFEVAFENVERLGATLAATGLQLSKESDEALASYRSLEQPISQKKDLTGSLQVTFIHNEPDLRREVPPIPG